ncbi:MATE family efflux transporter [Idiomarina xiamenensis]|uniref:Na+-driven multidrug efflux pump n=1 Tax=Idiomarina xiamenensis 10-D-4 TaxID=740709 RepID=K2JWL1_9GAMM|nr:MATE family efflux transporter [Idiomarina xiamenensis]EKE79898.1 Na+-driven multidrug efflux pump [Idiomarina xiamenensis 10-D-4]
MKAAVASRALLNDPIGKTLWRMTWPVIFGIATLISFNVVDTFFVGLLGTEPLAAVSFTFPVTFTVVSLSIGLGIGTSAVIARHYGAEQGEKAHFDGYAALVLSAVLVALLSLLGYLLMTPIFALLGASQTLMPLIRDYMSIWFIGSTLLVTPMIGNAVLRASGDTRTPSLIMASGGVLNAIFDPILIFGWGPVPAMGVQGAALASLISWVVGVALVLWLLQREKLISWIAPAGTTLWSSMRQILRIGLPAASANMLTPLAMAVMTAIIAAYGAPAVAAFGVGSRIESLASILILALSMSLPPFISQNVGAGRYQRVEQAYKTALAAIMALQLVIYVLLLLLADPIAAAFSQEQAVDEIVKLFIYIMPLGYGVQGCVILTNSSFNAIHQPIKALWLSVIRLFVFFVPCSYLGSLIADIHGLFVGGVIANLLTAVIAYLWFNQVLKQTLAQQAAR